ncbi:hypothetical protein ONZ45_g10857 [Pleurotus djamor]|nr:hypothetical protein ONZ45_g10857 [Pleurotus djamor]
MDDNRLRLPSNLSLSLDDQGITPEPYAQTSPGGIKPAFVKLAPGDRGDGFPLSILSDPWTFVPKPGPKGEIHSWGYVDPRADHYTDDNSNVTEFDGVSTMIRTMKYQQLYFGKRKPEEQFVDVLMERKKTQLGELDLGKLPKQDVIVKIYLKDGSVYGPEGCTSVDMAHVGQVGYAFLPDDKYTLAHLFGKEGDKIGYLYDFGDKWRHNIIIERILSVDDSDGSIKIVDGKGMCPGENLHGCFSYAEFMKEYDQADYVGKQAKKREVLDCPNYKGFGKPPALVDLSYFDMNDANERLSDALASGNSVRSGAKTFTMPVHPNGLDIHKHNLKKGQSIVRDFPPDEGGFWQETTSNKKDKKSETVCGACGKPGGAELKVCGGCRKIYYCSAAHQKVKQFILKTTSVKILTGARNTGKPTRRHAARRLRTVANSIRSVAAEAA